MAFARFRMGRILVVALLLFSLAGVAGGLWFYDEFLQGLPDLRRIEDYRPAVTSVVLDRKGRIIGEFYEEKRRLVPIGEIPRRRSAGLRGGRRQIVLSASGPRLLVDHPGSRGQPARRRHQARSLDHHATNREESCYSARSAPFGAKFEK